MFGDTVLAAEQRYLLFLALWGIAAFVLGAIPVLVARVRRSPSPLLMHFGLQLALWGLAEAVVAGVRYRGLMVRDLASTIRLERWTWYTSGFETGIVLLGLMIAIGAWISGRRLAGVGTGLAIAAHGAALLVLDLQLLAVLSK